MMILEVAQGSPEWHAARAQYFCASEASAMMGASKYTTRAALLKLKATGIAEEVDEHKQHLFDRGHEAEAAIRPHIESLIGEDLYPAVGVDHGLLASFDGISMDESTVFEHKLHSDDLAAAVVARELDPHYYWQLEHQLAVSGAKEAIFVCSDGTPERCVTMIYEPVPGRREQLLAGWRQFADDLASYQPTVESAPVTAAPTEALPAVSVRMDGAIAVISNLDVFGEKLKAFIANIDQAPETDQAFADAEAAVKTLEKAEDALSQAEASALAQTASIDDMRRTVALYRDMARTTRLALEKMVKARKDTIRIEIKREAELKLLEHIAAINKRLGKVQIPPFAVDFAGAMKGKKTLSSLRDAVDTELARAKIEASTLGDRIGINLATLRDMAADFGFLFADLQQICAKNGDDFTALVKSRIADHKAEEERRAEAQRERIRQEERQRAEAAAAKPQAPIVADVPSIPIGPAAAPTGAKIKLGEINAMIAPLSVTSDGLHRMGFVSEKYHNAVLFNADDLPRIFGRLAQHIVDAAKAYAMRRAA